MLNISLNQDIRQKFNDKGKTLLERFRQRYSEPFQFYKNTAFVDTIYIGNGRNLTFDSDSNKLLEINETKPVKYYTHNFDTTFDTMAALVMFDYWISHSETLKEMSK